ncbi:MAG: hypothetical protein WDZ59_11830 [Pirellulales bacterium]
MKRTAALMLLVAVGCSSGEPEGPSPEEAYATALAIYENETAAMEDLEQQMAAHRMRVWHKVNRGEVEIDVHDLRGEIEADATVAEVYAAVGDYVTTQMKKSDPRLMADVEAQRQRVERAKAMLAKAEARLDAALKAE